MSSSDQEGVNAKADAADLEHLRKIFVGGLSTQTTAETLGNYFEQYGKVLSAVVMRDSLTQRSRGFGFVTFLKAETVEMVQHARPHTIDHKTVETKCALARRDYKANSNTAVASSPKIFVGGLKQCHNEECLYDHFSQFGKVVGLKILHDRETGRHRGFGFVDFENCVSAERALAHVKHTIMDEAIDVKRSSQRADQFRRMVMHKGGASQAGYAPLQPATMDSFNYSPNYNPYVAHSSLPPTAFINGWASYVAPVASPPLAYASQQHTYVNRPTKPLTALQPINNTIDWQRNNVNAVNIYKRPQAPRSYTNEPLGKSRKTAEAAANENMEAVGTLSTALDGGGDAPQQEFITYLQSDIDTFQTHRHSPPNSMNEY